MTRICNNWSVYVSTLAANLFFISYGSLLAWNSPVLSKFRSNNTEINPLGTPLTAFQLSICTSIFPVGSIMAAVIAAKLPDIFGRRKTLFYSSTVGFISFILISFINHFWMYCLIFTILCISISAGIIVVPTYVSEISEIKNRGILGSFISVSKTLGQQYVFLLAPVTNFRIFALCCGITLLLHIVVSFFTQESPIFLSMKGDTDGAMRTLKKLRRNKTQSELEEEIKEKEVMLRSKNSNRSSLRVMFESRAGKKGLLISLVLRTLPHVSGIYVIISFMTEFLNESHSNISGDTLAIIVVSFKIVTAIICCAIVDRLGRKLLLLIGSFVCSVSMFGLAIYFFCKHNGIHIPISLRFLPVICILLFVIAYTLGLGAVPYIVISELLSNQVRATGTGLVVFIGNFVLLAITFGYPLISYYLGNHYCMFAFSICTFSGFVFIMFFVPETKGKSFSQITNMLGK